jgi:hypothetical protein
MPQESDYHSFSVDQGSAQIRLERTGTSTGVNYIGSDNRGLLITDSAFSTLAIFTANGLTFNGDTLAANALDDYEEGTFTPGYCVWWCVCWCDLLLCKRATIHQDRTSSYCYWLYLL